MIATFKLVNYPCSSVDQDKEDLWNLFAPSFFPYKVLAALYSVLLKKSKKQRISAVLKGSFHHRNDSKWGWWSLYCGQHIFQLMEKFEITPVSDRISQLPPWGEEDGIEEDWVSKDSRHLTPAFSSPLVGTHILCPLHKCFEMQRMSVQTISTTL